MHPDEYISNSFSYVLFYPSCIVLLSSNFWACIIEKPSLTSSPAKSWYGSVKNVELKIIYGALEATNELRSPLDRHDAVADEFEQNTETLRSLEYQPSSSTWQQVKGIETFNIFVNFVSVSIFLFPCHFRITVKPLKATNWITKVFF